MQLYSGETGEYIAEVGAVQVEQGAGRVDWNGLMPDGSAAPAGSYILAVQIKNFWQEESEQCVLSLHIYDSEEQAQENVLDLSTLVMQEAEEWEEAFDEPAQEAQPEEAEEAAASADPEIDALVAARTEAKKARNYAEADRIRDELKARGIEIIDTPQGAKWRRV